MEKIKENNNIIKLYLKGIVISLLILLGLTLILSIILSLINMSDKIIELLVMFIVGISILISTFFIGEKIKKRGILIGISLGICYMFTIYIISSIVNMNFTITLKSIEMIGMCIIFGTLGGILGVNLK